MSFLYVVTPLLDDEAFTRWLNEFGIMPPPGANGRFPTVREIRFLLEHLVLRTGVTFSREAPLYLRSVKELYRFGMNSRTAREPPDRRSLAARASRVESVG